MAELCGLQEVMINLGLVPFIDMYSDPDALNQLIIKMVRHAMTNDEIERDRL